MTTLAVQAYGPADVAYDPATHTSRLPDGRNVPHVTTVLKAVGLSQDFIALSDMTPRIAEFVRMGGLRGTAVHADCHAYDDNDLDWDRVDERVRPFVEAWAQFREDKGLVPLVRERHVYHRHLVYTGIKDGLFSTARLRRVLVDLKCGDPEAAAAHLQTAAYEDAWHDMHPDQPIDERWAVQLIPGRRVPYRVSNYSIGEDRWLDAGKFQAALTVYNEQPGRRRRRT